VEGSAPAERRAPQRLLVLGAGPAQLGLLEAARERGLYVIAVDRNPAAPGFRYADRRAIVSVEDERAIARLAAAEEIDGIVAPGIDYPVAIAARVAERLGLPHPVTPAAAQAATSKLRQRERFAEAGVPHTRHRVCASCEEALAAGRELGFPCVVKAPDLQGQKGLAVAGDEAAVPAAYERARELARGSAVLVEELVAGAELTVNGFSVGGRFHVLTVTDRAVAAPPAFGVALEHVWPSALAGEDVARAVQVAARAAQAVGITDGPTYTQVLLAPRGPVVGELAARLGGGHDAELCQAALGVDLNGLALAAALGEAVSEAALVARPAVGGACVRFLCSQPGVLESVEGVDEAERSDGVVWVRSYRSPGHAFGPLVRGADRAGAVLAVGATRDEARARAARAARRVRFVVSPVEALV